MPTGYFSRNRLGLVGLGVNPPPQLGQTFCNFSSAHSLQNVHSKEQIIASVLSLGRGFVQFSQMGLISSIGVNLRWKDR
jgi:hypothetical protein